MWFALLAPGLAATPAQAGDPIAGIWRCASGCRVTDANPSIETSCAAAQCLNEFGGIFRGARLSGASVACFNQVGTLSEDGAEVRWSGGMVWRRVRAGR